MLKLESETLVSKLLSRPENERTSSIGFRFSTPNGTTIFEIKRREDYFKRMAFDQTYHKGTKMNNFTG